VGGCRAKEIDESKLWYSGSNRAKNGVGILIEEELVEQVVEVKRNNDRIMCVKLVVGLEIFNVVSVYVPQIKLGEDIKRLFWANFDEVIQSIPQTEQLLIGGNFNGHIGRKRDGYETIYGGFGCLF